MLSLRGVSVRYGATVAVDGVDLDVHDAEKLSLLGPSGSGKSTLLRAVAGLEPLAGGSVTWNGADLDAVPTHRRGFGLMFQEYALFPHLDVSGNVSFGLRMLDMPPPAISRRVAEVLEMVGLASHDRRAMTELSGGEQQRVALARALAPRPRLLMLDEPLGALDRALRTRLLDELSNLFVTLRLPIIYVTHDQEEALAIGDRVAVMNRGRFEAVLPPAELWRRPPTEFVARFLGFANITDATVDGGRAVTPWGTFAVEDSIPAGEHRMLIRPDAFRPDPHGPLSVVVDASTFRGDHTRLRVRVTGSDGPPLEVHADWPDVPPVGGSLRLTTDPAGIISLPVELKAGTEE